MQPMIPRPCLPRVYPIIDPNTEHTNQRILLPLILFLIHLIG